MNTTPILNLPDEILMIIFELTIPQGNHHIIQDLQNIRNLAITCRRFHHLTIPILYRTLKFNTIESEANRNTHPQLHRTLKQNPSLRKHVRSLSLTLTSQHSAGYGADYSIEIENYSLATDYICWCRNVQDLHIGGDAAVRIDGQILTTVRWDLLQNALRHMPHLKRVEFGGHIFHPGYEFGIKFECLVACDELGGLAGGANIVSALGRDKGCELCVGWKETADEKRNELTHFTFSFDATDGFEADLSMFHAWLMSHREALQHITFGSLTFESVGEYFHGSEFPNLESVNYPKFRMEGRGDLYRKELNYSPSDAVDQLLGPKVEEFIWDFTSYDQQIGACWDDLSECEERWLTEFARLAVERKTALKTIRVVFHPSSEWGFNPDNEYPWDRMERIRDEIRPFGLGLKYNDPPLTREEYLKEGAMYSGYEVNVWGGD